MKKIVLTYGVIAGVIVSSMFYIAHPGGSMDFENGMYIGYASMIIAFSLIFFGVKNYRDNHLNGAITFGKAFKIGILVTLVASVMYALSWEVYFNMFAQDFMQKYSEAYLKGLANDGASAAEIASAKARLETNSELYKNPIFRFLFTLVEIVPVGLVVTLICAALLRRPQFLPKEAQS